MANWFSHALRDSALSWLLNLPEDSVNSWEELCKQFVSNFKGTYERNKIPNIPDTQVIATFREGVTNSRMLEKLGIHDKLTSVVKLFDLADKCVKDKEGLLFVKMSS